MSYPKSPVVLLLVILSFAIFSANTVEASDLDEVEKEVIRLLQTRDLTELANELAANNSTSSKDLLIKLTIFGQVGHHERVLDNIKLLAPKIGEFQTDLNKYKFKRIVYKAITNNFEANKIYFEQIEPYGGNEARDFVNLWKRNGDVQALEKWLFERKDKGRWKDEWISLKKELGTADEIYAEAEQEIRRNPKDFEKIRYYLYLVPYNKDVLWLLDVVPLETAYQTYVLANHIGITNPLLKIKLLEKSLTLPFTEAEKEKFIMDCAMMTSSGSVPKNPEKQLRFWTKQALIKIHNANKQPQLAQPYAEQLAALDTSDILWKDEIFINAGQTQAGSGKRVVEGMILQNEAEKRNLPQYWVERAKYYKGRKEEASVLNAIEEALKIFPYNPKDVAILDNRYEILKNIKWGLLPQEKVIEIYLNELKSSKNNPFYLFKLSIITLLPFDEIREKCSNFFADSDILIKMLAVREKWDGGEHQIIESLMKSGIWSQKEREKVYEKLTILAKQSYQGRLSHLAYAMFEAREYKMAIPLLQECLKIIPQNYLDESKTENFKRHLFESFIEIQDWQRAEKMYSEGYSYWGYEAAIIAEVAAKTGNIADAVRIWKIGANRDRRNLYLLEGLAKTEAKPLLREFYLELKQKDPLSDLPDQALKILK